jgi:CRISPR-associated protein Csd1
LQPEERHPARLRPAGAGPRPDVQEIPVPLNNTSTDPGYVCGRLTAVYELIAERDGNELSVNDLTLSATNPIYTLPRLRATLVNKTLARLRPRDPQGVRQVEDYLSELTAKLTEFPKRLTPRQQSQYVLGHAQQKLTGFPFRLEGSPDNSGRRPPR